MSDTLNNAQLRRHLARTKLVPVLRACSATALERQFVQAFDAGLDVIEVTATTPGWEEVLRGVSAHCRSNNIILGAGTITTVVAAETAQDAGAQFLVSPFPVPTLRRTLGNSTPLIEGGLTPAELDEASAQNGIAKLFPAATVGIGHLSALRDILPGRDFMPTGGITIDTATLWLDAGAIAVGMGGSLFRLPATAIAEFHQSLIGGSDA